MIDKNATPDSSATFAAPTLQANATSDKWEREYQAFLQLKPQLLATHAGSYVVVHNGQVVESGPDDVALAMRFFSQHGNVPVHIGLVSQSPESPTRIPHYRVADGGGGG